ncbi:MAG: dicarboxylate/amino acid:cation symporter, partial [Microbacteriaceae bacterium]|nr:dicarboxylate/amino acid:cation symporter [Microbacteriaceae bacterium]
MPGCSGIWPVIVAVFTINALGIEYSIWDYAALAGLCLLVSLGTAGVPGTAIITATAVLTAVGLPIHLLIVLIPISAVAGTASTMANVSAAATAATIVARRQGVLDDAVLAGTAARADALPDPAADAPGPPPSSIPSPGTAVLSLDEFFIPEGVDVGQCELPATRRSTRTDSVRTS